MPVTRSTSGMLQTIFRADIQDPQKENDYGQYIEKKQVNRVVASPEQLVHLDSLHKLSRSRTLLKEDILNAAAKTGLEEKWIRKWLTRRNHPRTSKSKARANSEAGTNTLDPPTRSQPLGNEDPNVQNSTTTFSMVDLLTDVSPRSISIAMSRPDISRSLSAPELHTPTCDSDNPPIINGPDYLRLLAMSPSLGYIPYVFSTTTTPDSVRASPVTDSGIMQLTANSSPRSQSLQSIISNPDFQTNVSDDGSGNCGTFDSSTLAQLLQQAATMSQTEYATEDERPASAASAIHPAIMPLVGTNSEDFSFAPSLQSHSTSVMFNQSTRLQMRPSMSYQSSFQPLPISYKTKLSDLMALSKRIRAADPDDLIATEFIAVDSEEGSIATSSSQQSVLPNDLREKGYDNEDEAAE